MVPGGCVRWSRSWSNANRRGGDRPRDCFRPTWQRWGTSCGTIGCGRRWGESSPGDSPGCGCGCPASRIPTPIERRWPGGSSEPTGFRRSPPEESPNRWLDSPRRRRGPSGVRRGWWWEAGGDSVVLAVIRWGRLSRVGWGWQPGVRTCTGLISGCGPSSFRAGCVVRCGWCPTMKCRRSSARWRGCWRGGSNSSWPPCGRCCRTRPRRRSSTPRPSSRLPSPPRGDRRWWSAICFSWAAR